MPVRHELQSEAEVSQARAHAGIASAYLISLKGVADAVLSPALRCGDALVHPSVRPFQVALKSVSRAHTFCIFSCRAYLLSGMESRSRRALHTYMAQRMRAVSPPLAQHVWSSPNLAAALARGEAAEAGGAASSSACGDAPAEGFAGGADGASFGGAAPGLGFGGAAARPLPAGGPASAMDRSASVDCMGGAPYWKPAAAGAPSGRPRALP